MEEKLEELLRGLALSNFYLKFERDEDPDALIVGLEGNIVHIGPSKGYLRFECGQGASAYEVLCVCSDAPGVIQVQPPPELDSIHTYSVHQHKSTIKDVRIQLVPVGDYRALASER